MFPTGLEHLGPASTSGDVRGYMAAQGFLKHQEQQSAQRNRAVREAGRLLSDVIAGREDPFLLKQAFTPTHGFAVAHLAERYPGLFTLGGLNKQTGLRETMSYSDYSALTVDVLDRMLYGAFTSATIENLPLCKKHTLRDFRLVKRFRMEGMTTPFTAIPGNFPTLTPHGAGEPPSERAMSQDAAQTYQPQLYQGKMAINWRALVNDDLGIFNDAINRLNISAQRTVMEFITQLYVSSTGPNTTLYNTSSFANLINMANGAASNNPALSVQGLIDAMTVLQKMLDSDGQPIVFNGTLYLWFGPALFATAMTLIKSVQADVSVGGGTTNAQGFPSQRMRVGNWFAAGMQPIQDKYIPLVCTTSGTQNTMWGLTYDPEAQARPGIELGRLAGFETPQIFQKVPNTMRVGGGVDQAMGDFYSMDQEYKGVLVLGGTQIDGRSTVASTGQGV